mmetsp:Transcript_20161/g.64150  ORF Transcript_20161/g.64150 Transcript_20161/m.64150 type:complete len:231 (-) Transcript_20161:180-872(-)
MAPPLRMGAWAAACLLAVLIIGPGVEATDLYSSADVVTKALLDFKNSVTDDTLGILDSWYLSQWDIDAISRGYPLAACNSKFYKTHTDRDSGNWTGVTCSSDWERVTEIMLDWNTLCEPRDISPCRINVPSLPASWSALADSTKLSLRTVRLPTTATAGSAVIPGAWSGLTKLKQIDLKGVGLKGPVPTFAATLSALNALYAPKQPSTLPSARSVFYPHAAPHPLQHSVE